MAVFGARIRHQQASVEAAVCTGTVVCRLMIRLVELRCVFVCQLSSVLAGYAHQSAHVVWAGCELGESGVGVSAWRDAA